MSLSHRYRDFGSAGEASHDDEDVPSTGLEEEKLQAFENGYQAGWDDATKAHATDQGRIASDFAQSLQDMSFTYYEARSKLTAAMHPLMDQIVTKLLPGITRKTLGAHVLEQLRDMLADQTERAVEIAVSPANLGAIEALMEAQLEHPFALKSEAALSDGQVYLRVASQEREINLDAVVSGISDALEAFFEQSQQEISNG